MSHGDTCTDHSPNLMNYSVAPVCPLYRPSLTEQATLNGSTNSLLHTSPLQGHSDDVCFMIEPDTSAANGLHTSTTAAGMTPAGPPQGLNWQAFMVDKWYCMRDRAMQDM